MRKISVASFFVLIISVTLFGSWQEVVEEIVAVVNEDIITLSDYKNEHDNMYELLRSQLSGEEFDKQYNQMKKELLNTMITNILLLQEAKRKGFDAGEQVRLQIENIKKENNINSDEDLRRALQQQGLVYEEWVTSLAESILRENVFYDEVRRNVVIDDSEVVNYYKLHPEEFTEPVEYTLKALYISAEGRSEEEVEAKKREIDEKIQAGEKIADLAGQYSEGPEKESQGDLGSFKKGQLEATLEQAVEELKVGDMTPWLNIRSGWYLLKLEQKKESRLKSFEEARRGIEERLFNQKSQRGLQDYLSRLRERSYIKILKPNPLDM
ncbi:MAG: SurA N-terminal domain-containing protein [Candidatus Aminicenantes bacterium]|nr:MAG: SurA N-terminal domain-containing protein [Candidatus Aminicenantes bacterium]